MKKSKENNYGRILSKHNYEKSRKNHKGRGYRSRIKKNKKNI